MRTPGRGLRCASCRVPSARGIPHRCPAACPVGTRHPAPVPCRMSRAASAENTGSSPPGKDSAMLPSGIRRAAGTPEIIRFSCPVFPEAFVPQPDRLACPGLHSRGAGMPFPAGDGQAHCGRSLFFARMFFRPVRFQKVSVRRHPGLAGGAPGRKGPGRISDPARAFRCGHMVCPTAPPTKRNSQITRPGESHTSRRLPALIHSKTSDRPAKPHLKYGTCSGHDSKRPQFGTFWMWISSARYGSEILLAG